MTERCHVKNEAQLNESLSWACILCLYDFIHDLGNMPWTNFSNMESKVPPATSPLMISFRLSA